MSSISIFAPAKLNLFLAVTGRRADGFHDLISVVAQVDFGDTLHCDAAPEFSLECDSPEVPCDGSNLVLKAAQAFVEATGWKGGAKFFLEKRIPVGAGLGGGSSDAVAALRALNRLADPNHRLAPDAVMALAARIGSDCPLFLYDAPVVMRGRGEKIVPLPAASAQRMRGRRVLIFKPGFGIATSWAYAQLAASATTSYAAEPEAEARLAAWMDDFAAPLETLLFNNMEPPAFAKFLALPVLLAQLQMRFGLQPRMSGSGSACFALPRDDADVRPVIAVVRDAWGESAFVIEARLT